MSSEGQNRGFPSLSNRLSISNANELGIVVSVMSRELPRDCIAHAYPNHEAIQMLPKELAYLATTDYLVQHARLSVEREDTGGKNILVPYWCGRVLPVAYGSFLVNGLQYGVITQKGGFPTGVPYVVSKNLPTNDPVYSYGFLQSSDAAIETKASNLALQSGMRSSLVLGTILLNPDMLEKRILDLWPTDFLSQQVLIGTLKNMVARGQMPSIILRLNSQLARVGNPEIDTSFLMHHTPRFYERRQGAYLAQQRVGFINWLQELQSTQNNISEIRATLNRLAYDPLGSATEQDFALFLSFYAELVNHEKAVAAVLHVGHVSEPACVRVLNTASREKDFEPSFVRTDYEQDPGDSDNPRAMCYGPVSLTRYNEGIDKIVECQWRTLKHFFKHLSRSYMRIFEFLGEQDVHISELFLND